MSRSTNDSYWDAVLFAVGERTVPQSEGLIGDLLSSRGVPSTVSGVDDHIAEVLIVFVATRKNYRLCTFVLASGNAGLTMLMYLSLRQLGARGEETTGRITCDVSKYSVHHAWTTP